MIPPKIQARADALVAAIRCGEVRPKRLHTREATLVVNMGMRWRLVDVAGKGNWQVMSHERYNKYCNVARNHNRRP